MSMSMKQCQTNSEAVPAVNVGWPRGQIQTLVLMGATALGIYLCYRLTLPFLAAHTWALAPAVLFSPLHRWVESALRRPGLAAAASVMAVGLIVAVPATFVVQRLLQEAAKGAETIQVKVESGEWLRAIEAQPRLAPLADWIERKVDLPEAIKDIATWLTATGGSIVKGSVYQAIGFCLIHSADSFLTHQFDGLPVGLHPIAPLQPMT